MMGCEFDRFAKGFSAWMTRSSELPDIPKGARHMVSGMQWRNLKLPDGGPMVAHLAGRLSSVLPATLLRNEVNVTMTCA
ncbi:hypothetical protein XaplCFBP3122_20215 [Xanthomonas arboricola pv. populi]|uniref:Uncharacterized protein n=1 Tax=Xanthomonas arboricola pv. populi TaxID=487823 RepID=A0A2S6YZB2_9XANT|nr:hypothetical protein XaplCFBP3122_20215 [Xanthomonas arboricola pv. populi]